MWKHIEVERTGDVQVLGKMSRRRHPLADPAMSIDTSLRTHCQQCVKETALRMTGRKSSKRGYGLPCNEKGMSLGRGFRMTLGLNTMLTLILREMAEACD